MARRYEVSFEHTSGGDSLLPREHRGYFDSWTVDLTAESAEEAERLGMEAVYGHVAQEHPDWIQRAYDDLVAHADAVD